MQIMNRIVWSTVVCTLFVAGCVASEPEPTAAQEASATVEQVDQSIGGTTQAQERETTYYSEPQKINIVGFCIGPYRCFGPKGLRCSGIKTQWFDVEFTDCPDPRPLP